MCLNKKLTKTLLDSETGQAHLCGRVKMCVSQSVVVHLELEDSVNIRQLELDAVSASYRKNT